MESSSDDSDGRRMSILRGSRGVQDGNAALRDSPAERNPVYPIEPGSPHVDTSQIPLLLRESILAAPSSPVQIDGNDLRPINLAIANLRLQTVSDLHADARRLAQGRISFVPHRPAPPTPFEQSTASAAASTPSAWLNYLMSRGLIGNEFQGHNWSGRGQHVEFGRHEVPNIPLVSERVLGHTSSALVESVICRDVRLARKTVQCTRRLKREDALREVEHLHRVEHSHVVRVVGTYVVELRKEIAILLYPVADYNLDTFFDSIYEELELNSLAYVSQKIQSAALFFGCLAQTLSFLHAKVVKHMDIKPKNLLVRDTLNGRPSTTDDHSAKYFSRYKIYVADFGIARTYKSVPDAETDNPTAFTRMYAAPEVVSQVSRGLKADIFSLGCVFVEIIAALVGDRQVLANIRESNEDDDPSFSANIKPIRKWIQSITITDAIAILPDQVHAMLSPNPNHRPSARRLATFLGSRSCCVPDPDDFVKVTGTNNPSGV